MIIRRARDFIADQSGSSAAEFVLVLPLLLLLTIGTIYLTFMLQAASSLHFAVQDAARCRAVKTLVCTNQTTTEAYAATRYSGPGLTSLTFTSPAAAVACGYQVSGAGSFSLRTGLMTLAVPLNATACFPD